MLKTRYLSGVLLICAASATLGRAAPIHPSPPTGSAEQPARVRVFGALRRGSARGLPASRLDGTLAEIAQQYPSLPAHRLLESLHALNPAARFRLSVPLATPEILVDAITVGDPQALARSLHGLGLSQGSVFANDVGGWLPVDQVARLESLDGLHLVRTSMPRTRIGPVAIQGDYVQRTTAVRATYPSLTGAGIMVGVLSNSFNCYQTYANQGVPASGFSGYASNGFTATYASDQSAGVLPAGVQVLEEASCMNYGAPQLRPFTDEGRAILQIVHAIAPGAQLAFYTAFNSEADFANGIIALAKAGARIIDDDVGYPDEPFYQNGIIAQAVNQVAAAGVAYFSSAGNDARNSWESTAPAFPVVSTTAPNAGEKLLNFDTSGGTTATSLSLSIPALEPGEFIFLVVEWDQPYVSGAPLSGGATSSIDLCVTASSGSDPVSGGNGTGTVSCTGPNAAGVDPVQILTVGNPANASGKSAAETLQISIGLANGTAPPGRLKFLLSGDGARANIDATYATYSPTVQGHPEAAGATAVGAAFYFDTPACGTTPATLERFSSAGGDPILFDDDGHRLAQPQVYLKPAFVAPDGANDTFLGFTLATDNVPNGLLQTSDPNCQNQPAWPNFFGTSAAAPHAAAAAALLWQANAGLTATQLVAALSQTALPMGNGVDDDNGAGLIQVDTALAWLPAAAPTLTIDPSTITVGGSATLSWTAVNTTGCSASGSWSGSEPLSGKQTVTAARAGTNTYTLTCSGVNGTVSSSVSLDINAAGSGGGSGGGNLDLLSLLTLGASLALRRRLRQPPDVLKRLAPPMPRIP